MNFTRDPIIETVITPREGCKLVVRSSKTTNQEDYLVESLEVVSFGHSLFFRSQERPKSFLVPVTDYEVFEVKEPKMVLKSPNADRSIKIGGGRDVTPRPSKDVGFGEIREETPMPSSERGPSSDRSDRKRDRQRRRGRRGRDRHESFSQQQEQGEIYPAHEEVSAESVPQNEQESVPPIEAPKEKAPSFISKLFPPPPTLIKETLGRYKTVDSSPEDMIPFTSPDEKISYEENASFDEEIIERPIYPESVSEENDQEEEKEE